MPQTLRRTLATPALIALGAAGVVGTSWIYTNGRFFADVGAGGEVFGLALATVLAVCIATAYAELATRLPHAGGEIVYGEHAFGRRVAFVAGWLLTGAYISSLGFYVTAAGSLLGPVWPALQAMPLYHLAGAPVTAPVLGLGIALTAAVYTINVRGAALGGSTQILLFTVMLAIGLALTLVGFIHGRAANFWPAWAPDAHPLADTLRFVLPALTFLTGFSLVTLLAEDAAEPPRRVAGATIAAVVIAGTFYCVVLTASAWIIPWRQTAKLARGTIDAYRLAGFPWLSAGALAIAVLGLLTSFIALFLAASRILLAMARTGLLPGALARIDARHGMPVNALRATGVLTIGLGLLGPGALTWFLDTGGVYVGIAWLIGVASFYRLRRRADAPPAKWRARPGWLPGVGGVAAGLIIAAIVLPGSSMSLAWPGEYLMLGGWLALGAAVYALGGQRRPRADDARRTSRHR